MFDLTYSKMLVYLFIGVILTLIIMYVSFQLNKKIVCPPLPSKPVTTVSCYDNNNPVNYLNVPITKLYIKTAYNCCCKGNFKNDFVDIKKGEGGDYCALKNCALNGVRALDFTIFSLNNKPVISGSTRRDANYKELYNHLDFDATMREVYRFFLYDSNISNIKDPLFLIFRIQSDILDTYNSVAYSITQVFGVGNQFGNLLFSNGLMPNTKLLSLQNRKVVIIVQPNNSIQFDKSNLNQICAYKLNPDGITSPCINRFSDKIDRLNEDIHFLFPNYQQATSSNFDPDPIFKSTAVNKITFIGMNFQTNDANLQKYKLKFGNSSFLLQNP